MKRQPGFSNRDRQGTVDEIDVSKLETIDADSLLSAAEQSCAVERRRRIEQHLEERRLRDVLNDHPEI